MTANAAMKSRLEARKAELTARLAGIEAELESHEAKDWEEQAVEREGDEVLEGMGISGQQELRMIEAALGRIAAGDYGTCARCGAEIAAERLAAVPYTPFCRACAQ
ncbi:MAG: TraR/DksA C4-type zinc finger protein [Gemmobacter sp.]|uniref:TraR/DksA family transcriptional regulator n=1 Tax=Gemmobacter sp. TaxID=1898957 RepID=UPI001A4EB648|nr:TraR/DksA C4-type zinc finger protein [Gemmobacter sp.]MBL8560983.1 TraR/DksA C4-type zinc finger protein [Gemmobacter sp.]